MDAHKFLHQLGWGALFGAAFYLLEVTCKHIYHRDFRPLDEAIFVGVITLVVWGISYEILFPSSPVSTARVFIFLGTGLAVAVSLLTHPRRRRA